MEEKSKKTEYGKTAFNIVFWCLCGIFLMLGVMHFPQVSGILSVVVGILFCPILPLKKLIKDSPKSGPVNCLNGLVFCIALVTAVLLIFSYTKDLKTDKLDAYSMTEKTDDREAEEPESVWVSESGSKYHIKSDCSNMKSVTELTLKDALEKGYEACKRCVK